MLLAKVFFKNNFGILSYMEYKKSFHAFIEKFKQLRGDPDYIGRGMAIGVLVGVTPTFPFHTTLALALATMLRGSRPAAMLGVWFGNPVTMPLFYIASYKAGMLLLGKALPSLSMQQQSLPELLHTGLDVVCAMIAGGVVIGIIPSIAAYFITRRMVSAFNAYKNTAA